LAIRPSELGGMPGWVRGS